MKGTVGDKSTLAPITLQTPSRASTCLSGQRQLGCSFSFADCLGHAHVLLAAFERVRFQEEEF